MATIKAKDLIANTAATVLNDPTYTRWSQQELLGYLNDGQREIVNIRPDAGVKSVTHTCVAASKQTLPADASMLVDVTRNTDGTAITKIERSLMDIHDPNWHEAGITSAGVYHYIYEIANPKTFYLYPKPATTNQVELVYAAIPADIVISNFTSDTQVIKVDDNYSVPLMNYILYRAFMKDSEYADAQRSTAHYQLFQSSLGLKTEADGSVLQSMASRKPGVGR